VLLTQPGGLLHLFTVSAKTVNRLSCPIGSELFCIFSCPICLVADVVFFVCLMSFSLQTMDLHIL